MVRFLPTRLNRGFTLYPRRGQGFTLIELIVVITILGILAVVIMTVLDPVTQFKKGRDSQRRNILKQMQTVLEQYYNDNGSYPTTTGAYYSSDPSDTYSNNSGNWIPGVVPKYTQSLPSDPIGGTASCAPLTGNKRAFIYRSDGTQYVLISCGVEVASNASNTKDNLNDTVHANSWKVCMGDTACTSW